MKKLLLGLSILALSIPAFSSTEILDTMGVCKKDLIVEFELYKGKEFLKKVNSFRHSKTFISISNMHDENEEHIFVADENKASKIKLDCDKDYDFAMWTEVNKKKVADEYSFDFQVTVNGAEFLSYKNQEYRKGKYALVKKILNN